jgi:hypothetical protein
MRDAQHKRLGTAAKKQKRRFLSTTVFSEPSFVEIDVDMLLLANAAPKLTIKELVVVAMALGGRLLMADPLKGLGMRIQIEVAAK